ncbi:septum formation inhibitor Maf [Ulvibacterium sp.]|uniref:septum formation inhibitor Maf n=1 Tax=Ulvibacterium sp. TaxID=2665914 RepID=UPI00261A7B05|nr:septum formation inhibitor Maf [Ulvibacterium sp.]
MKKWITFNLALVLFAILMTTLGSCKGKGMAENKDIALNESAKTITENPKKKLSQEFRDYWYAGEAEITSYALEQPRYGQMRDGHAVLVFVTEPFSADKQVKADAHKSDNIPVLKLNSTKKYLTGIYPYSIMSSSFYPVHDNGHSLKVTFSAQEWCGQVYAQLNNRDQFEIMSHSYFESEADQNLTLDKVTLENEIWNKIRIDPKGLPVGDVKIIPALEYIRLSHKELKSYDANARLTDDGEESTYIITYPELARTLKIKFSSSFPYTIEGWTETFISGYGPNAKTMTSRAKKIKSITSPYWQRNGNEHVSLRDSLGL